MSRAPRGDKTRSDVGIDATQHEASTTGWQRPAAGQEQNHPSATGHYRMGSVPGPSMLRYADDDEESVMGSVVGTSARTEPIFGGRSETLLGTGGTAFAGGFSAEVAAPEAFVGGFAMESTVYAVESGITSQPLFALGQSNVPSHNPSVNPIQTPAPTPPDIPVTTFTTTDPQPLVDNFQPSNTDSIPSANANTAAFDSLQNFTPNADDSASNSNPPFTAGQRPAKKKKPRKDTAQAPSTLPETIPEDQQQTSAHAQISGPDSQNPAGSAPDPFSIPDGPIQDAAAPVQRTTEIDTDTMKHGVRGVQGPDFSYGNPSSPPPPFKEVGTPIEPTLLTLEQTERESLRGEFLMRELKQLEMLVVKAESGAGRGSPSALSVDRLNGIRERLGMVRVRVERRVYEDPPADVETPPQLTLSGIDGPSAVDLVQTAIVDMLLETPHAESLAVVGYINKQKKGNAKTTDLKNVVVDWVKENKFKVRNDPTTPFILNITF